MRLGLGNVVLLLDCKRARVLRVCGDEAVAFGRHSAFLMRWNEIQHLALDEFTAWWWIESTSALNLQRWQVLQNWFTRLMIEWRTDCDKTRWTLHYARTPINISVKAFLWLCLAVFDNFVNNINIKHRLDRIEIMTYFLYISLTLLNALIMRDLSFYVSYRSS